MQNKWFEKKHLNCIYLAFESKDYELKHTIESLKNLKFKGFNITIPHKVEAMKYVDVIDKNAKKIGSINTVINKNNKLYGYNTDYLGFAHDLKIKKVVVKNKNILIIGAGGAARGIIYTLKTRKAKNIYIASRTSDKSVKLAQEFKIKSVNINNIKDVLDTIDVLINCSSCGLQKGDKLPFSEGKIKKNLVVYDLVYNGKTPFVEFAKRNKLKVFTGRGMLIWQGAYAFNIWTGDFPDVTIAERLLRKFLK
jgi:shikimate dehydrogenase